MKVEIGNETKFDKSHNDAKDVYMKVDLDNQNNCLFASRVKGNVLNLSLSHHELKQLQNQITKYFKNQQGDI